MCAPVARLESGEESDSEPDFDPERESVIRAKWQLDGCKTLAEVVRRLHDVATHYEHMRREGWELTGPVDDDYGYIERRD